MIVSGAITGNGLCLGAYVLYLVRTLFYNLKQENCALKTLSKYPPKLFISLDISGFPLWHWVF